MKSNIIINDKNLSRYNKRFQKVISEKFGEKINLSEASDLFAKVLGMTSVYELKKLLEEDLTEDFKEKIKASNLSTMDKLVLISKQIQKMLKGTKAEYWYPIFCVGEVGSFYNNHRNKPGYNNIDILASYTGFRPFSYDISEIEDDDNGISETLELECVNFGDIMEDVEWVESKNHDFYDKDDEIYLSFKNRKEAYSSKNEIKKLNEMMTFCEDMLEEVVNLMKHYNDVWVVEKDRITIKLGNEKRVI